MIVRTREPTPWGMNATKIETRANWPECVFIMRNLHSVYESIQGVATVLALERSGQSTDDRRDNLNSWLGDYYR